MKLKIEIDNDKAFEVDGEFDEELLSSLLKKSGLMDEDVIVAFISEDEGAILNYSR